MLPLTILIAAVFTTAGPASPAARCKLPAVTPADGRAGALTIRRLDQMPPARQFLGVFRMEDGCPKPIVVRDEVGQPRRAPAAAPH